MNTGTKSLLFGVHAFWYHGPLVALAWKRCYGKWPCWWELLACLCHDVGLWGSPDMDGVGASHPRYSAVWTVKAFGWLLGKHSRHTFSLIEKHSRRWCASQGYKVSRLALPDKYSLCMEWPWFYLLRARLSGELSEYRQDAHNTGYLPLKCSDRLWWEIIAQDRRDMLADHNPCKFSVYYEPGKKTCPCAGGGYGCHD